MSHFIRQEFHYPILLEITGDKIYDSLINFFSLFFILHVQTFADYPITRYQIIKKYLLNLIPNHSYVIQQCFFRAEIASFTQQCTFSSQLKIYIVIITLFDQYWRRLRILLAVSNIWQHNLHMFIFGYRCGISKKTYKFRRSISTNTTKRA